MWSWHNQRHNHPLAHAPCRSHSLPAVRSTNKGVCVVSSQENPQIHTKKNEAYQIERGPGWGGVESQGLRLDSKTLSLPATANTSWWRDACYGTCPVGMASERFSTAGRFAPGKTLRRLCSNTGSAAPTGHHTGNQQAHSSRPYRPMPSEVLTHPDKVGQHAGAKGRGGGEGANSRCDTARESPPFVVCAPVAVVARPSPLESLPPGKAAAYRRSTR